MSAATEASEGGEAGIRLGTEVTKGLRLPT